MMRDGVRIAVVEIGTNSTKLLVADTHRGGSFRVAHFSRRTTRIGTRLGCRRGISGAALDVTVDTLARLGERIQSLDCSDVFAFGTQALRSLGKMEHARRIHRRLEAAIGVPIRVLSGNEEARFAYKSAVHNLALVRPHTVLVDIGGGSTEFIVAERARVRRCRSLPIGALHLTERFIHTDPIDGTEFLALTRHVDRTCRRAVADSGLTQRAPNTIDLAASGGTIGSLALVMSGRTTFSNGSLPPRIMRGQVTTFLSRCLALPLPQRRRIRGLEPERADIICAGLAIVLSMMEAVRKRVLYPNSGGVREGALIHLMENGLRW